MAKRQIPYRFVLSVTAATLLFSFISAVSFFLYSSVYPYLRSSYEELERRTLSEASSRIDRHLSTVSEAASILLVDESLSASAYRYDSASPKEQTEIRTELRSLFYQLIEINDQIGSLVLFTEENALVFGDLVAGESTMSDFERLFSSRGQSRNGISFYLPSTTSGEMSGLFAASVSSRAENVPLLSAGGLPNRFFFSLSVGSSGQRSGIVCLVLRSDFLTRCLNDLPGTVVTDSDGNPLCNLTVLPDYELQSQLHSSDSKRFLQEENQTFDHLTVYYQQQTDRFSEKHTAIVRMSILFMSVTILFALISSYFAARYITRPITLLSRRVGSLEYAQLLQSHLRRGKISSPGGDLSAARKLRRRPRSSTRQSLFLYFLSVIICPCLIFSFCSVSWYSYLERQIEQELFQSSLDIAAKRSEEFFQNLKNSAVSLAYDDTVLSCLRTAAPLPSDIGSALPHQMRLFSYDVELAFYSRYARPLVASSDAIFRTTPPSVTRGAGNILWDFSVRSKQGRYVTFGLGINDPKSGLRLGFFKCRTDESFLESCYAPPLSNSLESYICTESGIIVSHPNKALIGSRAAPAEGALRFQRKLGETGFTLVAFYNSSQITAHQQTLFIITLCAMLIIIFVAFFVASFLSYYIAKHINRCFSSLSPEAIQAFSQWQEPSRIAEVAGLERSFHLLLQKINQLVEDITGKERRQHELEILNQKSELLLLQSQINPHFLYNTFESINFMIRLGEKAKATRMVTLLSRMFRYAVKTDDLLISLDEELSYCTLYADIMNMRFGSEIVYSCEADESVRSLRTLKFILQPLVENAYSHGLKQTGHGEIHVRAYVQSETLIVTVHDSGAGLSSERLYEVRAALENGDSQQHIGLCNINRRIRLTFGEQYGLTIESSNSAGTTVTLLLPVL